LARITALAATVPLLATVAIGNAATAAVGGGSEILADQEQAKRTRKPSPEVTLKLKPGSEACLLTVKLRWAPRRSTVHLQARGNGGWKNAVKERVEKGNSRISIDCARISDEHPSGRTAVRALLKRGRQTLDRSRPLKLPDDTTLDMTPPQTTISGGSSAGTIDTRWARFLFSSSEPGSTFECSLDGGVFAACSSPHEIADLTEGGHTFRVRATDQAGNTDRTPAERNFTVDVPPPSGSFKSVSLYWALCAIRADDSIGCWDILAPPPGSFKAVTVGGSHACAIRFDDSIACWGDNLFLQATPPSGSFKSISAGDQHTCAIRADDSIACWGDGRTGLPGSFNSVSAGGGHACAIRADDSIVCWGSYLQPAPPSGSFKAVSTTSNHTCAIRTDDSIVCWGSNLSGEATPPSGSFKAVDAAIGLTCAIRSDDTIACWGRDEYGQANPPAGSFKAVTVFSFRACAIRADDSIACWGLPFDGKL